jgi:hypothetical protein
MIAGLKGRSLIFRIVWFVAFVPMFIPMFIYELVMFMIGKRKYSKRQYEREFDYGYNPLRHGRKETDPKYPHVWADALEKSYEEFAGDLRWAALMGIVYRFREPKTTGEFDQILSDHVSSLRRELDLSPSMTAVRLWNPVNVVSFLDQHYKKNGFDGVTHYYIHEKEGANEWRIIKLGVTEFKPEQRSRSILYYEEYFRVTPVQHVEYSFSGDGTSIRNIRFQKSTDADLTGKTVGALCNFAAAFVSAMFAERDAAVIIAKLDVSHPQPFECVVQSARIKLDWKISRPYWSEPDQVLAGFTIEEA